MTVWVTSGMAVGTVIAVLTGLLLLSTYGWRVMFFVTAIPLVLLILQYFLPESMSFYIKRGQNDKIAKALEEANPEFIPSKDDQYQYDATNTGKVSLLSLFKAGLGRNTIIFWAMMFFNYIFIYAVTTWLTQLMKIEGYSLGWSLGFTLIYNLGFLLGIPLCGWQLRRLDIYSFLLDVLKELIIIRIIVGITGASGVILGVNLLKALSEYPDCETHLIMTEGANRTFQYETGLKLEEVVSLADYNYDIYNLAATISSGSFKTDGMVIIPCSMKTLAGVVTGYSDNLLLRSADVCLKERRRVILVPRELPLSSIHLGNLSKAAQHGCVILPPMLTFYNNPTSIQDMIDHLVGKIMMQFDLEFKGFVPWKGDHLI